MWLTYRSCMSADVWQLWQKKSNANLDKPNLHIEHCLYAAYILTLICVFFFQSIFFFLKLEGTYKFVGKNETQGFFCIYCWCSRTQLKLTTNSTNAMCNISNYYVACVDICKGITSFWILISINCFKPSAHNLSRCSRATSKFCAPQI